MNKQTTGLVMLGVAALAIIGVGFVALQFFKTPQPVTLTMVLTYENGKTVEVQGEAGKTITYTPPKPDAVAQTGSQSPLAKVDVIVKGTPSWVQTPQTITGASWTATGKISVDGVQKLVISQPTANPSSITAGTTYTIYQYTIQGSELNAWIPFDYKDHKITADVALGLTFTPPGDTTKNISGSGLGTVSLHNIGFPALLSVTVSTPTS